jgi:hypothetical protein
MSIDDVATILEAISELSDRLDEIATKLESLAALIIRTQGGTKPDPRIQKR